MTREWQPSTWGRLFTKSKPWRLSIENDGRLVLSIGERAFQIAPEDTSSVVINRGIFWSDVTLSVGRRVRIDGLPNSHQPSLTKAVKHLLLVNRRRRFDSCYLELSRWLAEVSRVVETADAEQRWLTHDMQQRLLEAKPALAMEDTDLQKLFLMPDVQASLKEKASLVGEKLQDWMSDWPQRWADRNKRHMAREREACKTLLEKVESKPLTGEQSDAVICFDNRVQVIASAGSGKTSTMVAKAIYAIHRNLVAPSSIVMLAFNKDAAKELKTRAAASLARLGRDNVAIEAMTFHSLGLAIIGGATGKKPHVPIWASKKLPGIEKLTAITDELKDQSDTFRINWDLFRLVFGRDLPSTMPKDLFDAYNSEGQGQLISLNGDHVASQEERMIANWLFYNGVEYTYERPYEHETATAQRRQYFPDFFYPQINLYHEHFALDAHGQAPEHFEGYLEDAAWKRELHKAKGTQLIETTSHQVNTGQIFKHLSQALTLRGIELDPNPDRPIPESGLVPMEHLDLIKVLRSFITHFKSNSLSIETLYERLEKLPLGAFKYRYQMFLELAVPTIGTWDKALRGEGGIDFEDMINNAAEHLEQGHPSPYELVMADEYQDASRARARLCRALVAKPDRYLFAVGDDWQSINRFAGADVSVMTGFRDWFGHGEVLRLEKTFRCPQAICDASSHFVSKNPAQLQKIVVSDTPPIGPELTAFQVERRDEVPDAVSQYVERLYNDLVSGEVPSGRGGKTTVFVLGRYKKDVQYVPEGWISRYGDRIEVRFKTIHTSKGDEADYVILPGLIVRGFPNLKGDDQVFGLVMPEGDYYLHGEERRLFYVALTRARRSVAMFTVKGQCSPFLDELVKDGKVTITCIKGEQVKEDRCPVCKYGVILARTGPYGDFRSCSNYSRCKYKPKKSSPAKAISPQSMRISPKSPRI
ncbi:UvrD-helicase domain-containing protein [Pseudomonas sp. 8O]|uniref:UvrD-helicase domain-containing protein n=1 Tax=Pseudomonas sp. 8O TaxID=2653165 RepID=UPI0012F28613|nr:UvrD-helicase domain-containing protein [Pseudomonas sp. 8O]VXB17092.1 DNA helicase [Pseudomonas sp. 8O]